MRSELIHRALEHEQNRYMLCRLIAKGTRMLHRPNTRIEETTNSALEFFGHGGGVIEGKAQGTVVAEERRAA